MKKPFPLTSKSQCANDSVINQDEYIKKIRRRIEDYLRKTNDEVIMEVALYLNINTD